MCDQHDGLVEVMGECTDHRHDLGFGFRVKVAGRLIGEHHLGLGHKRPGDADALLLAARHLARVMAETMAEPDPCEHATRRTFALFLGHAAEHQRHCHVFERGQIGQQVVRLEYEAKMLLAEGRQLTLVEFADGYAADSHAAARRFFHAGQLVEQRGFAGAGFAENAADLALRDTEIDTVKRHHRLILDGVFLA